MTQNVTVEDMGPQKALVLDFLKTMEARDLEKARTMISSDFVMEFPGSGKMTRFEDLIAWAKDRYQFVTKTIEDVSTAAKEDGDVVVYCHGMLAGRWKNDVLFENVRFIDRFVVRDGLIVQQDVWNDLALHTPDNNK
ncbi:nuclear transport factor 2 family protein [Terasakiella pusilla]|uniref:nuclear transport factor 2 family protein n=1 Tax=Terasakiella pusilla TaxID=64973 RepID=UPI003AA89D93